MSRSKENPPQNPPPVQKLRLRYAKTGRARFTSHRDFARAFERAVRRADLPMALSSGFNQHPRISYANATPTGAATYADYLEIGLARVCDPHWVVEALSAALPDGMSIMAAHEASGTPLGQQLTASTWTVELRGVSPDALARAVSAAREAPSLMVSRQAKEGVRTFDCVPALIALDATGGDAFTLTLHHTSPLVRPDDVVQALRALGPELDNGVAPLLTRMAQGVWEDGAMVEPFGVPESV